MARLANWAALAVLAISTPAQAGSLSGTYVGTGPDIAVLLQLVEAGDGQLTGRYEQVKLVSGPKIDRFNASVKGNVDGNTIVFEMKPTEILSGTFVVSGTVTSNALRLTGGGYGTTLNLNLSRASEEAFNSQVAALASQESQVNAARALATDAQALEVILQKMATFNWRAADDLKKIPPVEERFQMQTKAMEAALAKQRSFFPADGNVAVRSQINGAIYRAGGESTQLHVELQSAHADFETRSVALLNEANALNKKCQSQISIDEKSKPVQTWNSICAQLPSAASNFRNQATQMLTSFAHAETTWQKEERKQQIIMKSSDVAAR
jgi:hypothetical protein